MILDVAILASAIAGTALGLLGGLLRAAVLLVALAAGVGAWFWGSAHLPMLPLPPFAPWLRGIVLGAGVTVLATILFALVARRWAVRRTAWWSRLVGGGLGAAVGCTVAVLALTVAAILSPEAVRGLTDARSYPPLASAAEAVAHAAPPAAGLAALDLPPPTAPAPEVAAAGTETPPRPIAWAEIGTARPALVRRYTGTVAASIRVPLSFEVGGQLADVSVAVGERVAEGAPVARLDPTQLRLDVEEREAALLEAEAVLAEAELNHDRRRILVDRGVEAQSALDAAEAALGTARSRVGVARSALARARDTLESNVVYAPYPGTIAARYADPPAVVRAGEPIVDLERADGPLEIEVEVPEDVRALLEIGQRHAVEANADDDLLPARVIEIGARLEGRATYPVNLALDGPSDDLRTGATRVVRFLFDDAGRDGIAVPAGAVAAGGGDSAHVFAFDPEASVVRARAVRVLDYAGDLAWIDAALAPGTIVATRGVPFLRDGQRVELMGAGVARYER